MKDNPTNEGALGPKGNACLDEVYHLERLLYPMKKVNGQIEHTSWDDALDLLAANRACAMTRWLSVPRAFALRA